MKKNLPLTILLQVLFLFCLFTNPVSGQMPDTSLIVNFSMTEYGCVQQNVTITYTGNAPENATYIWDFNDGVIINGSGQGPYKVKWETPGIKTVTLIVHWDTLVGDKSRQIHINPLPEIFHMTGGGSYPAGGSGVEVGLSGSQLNVVYRLRRGSEYTGMFAYGTGGPISFGLQFTPGSYNAVADTLPCIREMEGVAVVSVIPFPDAKICMVTYDTLSQKNKVIWNKTDNTLITQVNIYKETSQNEVYEKIAEVPWSSAGIYLDENSFPLVRSYKYRISYSDTQGEESEKGAYHKTVHLNINAGIYGFNLIWNHYEGFEFKTYNIYRKIGEGPYEMIAQVASNMDSYTDFYTSSGLVTYYLEIVRQEPCQPELKGGYDRIVSNIATAAPLGVEDQGANGWLIYPNPVKEKIFIVSQDLNSGSAVIELFALNGQKILEMIINGKKSEIGLGDVAKGVYFMRITSDNSTIIRKIIRD